MTLHKRDGSLVTSANLSTLTTAVSDADPLVRVNEDLVSKRPFGSGRFGGGVSSDGQTASEQDRNAEAGGDDDFEQQAFLAGEVVRTSRLLAFLSKVTNVSLSPVSGAAVGGTVVTIKGEGLDGVTGVTFGGTPGTNLTKVSSRQIKVTTPAHAAGAVAVGIADDGGLVTIANGYTFV